MDVEDTWLPLLNGRSLSFSLVESVEWCTEVVWQDQQFISLSLSTKILNIFLGCLIETKVSSGEKKQQQKWSCMKFSNWLTTGQWSVARCWLLVKLSFQTEKKGKKHVYKFFTEMSEVWRKNFWSKIVSNVFICSAKKIRLKTGKNRSRREKSKTLWGL